MRRSLALSLFLLACSTPPAQPKDPPAAPSAEPALVPAAKSAPPAVSSAPPAASSAEAPKTPPRVTEAAKERLARALAADFKAAPKTSSYLVATSDGQRLAAHQETLPLVPASNTKLLTTGAALAVLGPDHTHKTPVFVTGRAGARVKTLTIVGRHDATWSELFFDDPMVPVRALAAKVKEAGITRVDLLEVKGAPIFAPKRFDEIDLAKHRDVAQAKLRQALEKAGVTVGRAKAKTGFAPPEGATLLFEHASPPLSKVIEPINKLSHNPMADALLQHLGHEKKDDPTFAGGAKVEAEWLATLGIEGLSAEDGSGLSRKNAFTAEGLAKLLLAMQKHEHAALFEASLSVAGEVGTLKNRLADGPAKGRFRGKTGTLDGVVSLSGYLAHPTDGRTYVVVILMNGTTDGAAARKLEDVLVDRVASSWAAAPD